MKSRRLKRSVWALAALACAAVVLVTAQLLLPQEMILERVKGELEEAWGVRPDVKGFGCTILGTFRVEEIRGSDSTSWVRIGAAAEGVRGRVSLPALLGGCVNIWAEAEELRVRVISYLDSESEALLTGVSLHAAGGSSQGETRMRLAAASAEVDEVKGGRVEIKAVDRHSKFVVEEAYWDLTPGWLRFDGEFGRAGNPYLDAQVEVEGVDLARVPPAQAVARGSVSGRAEARGGVESGWGEASISFSVKEGKLMPEALEGLEGLSEVVDMALGTGEFDGGLPFRELSASLAANAAGVTVRSFGISGEGYSMRGTGFASITGKLSFLLRGDFGEQGKGNITIEGTISSPEVSWIPAEGVTGVSVR